MLVKHEFKLLKDTSLNNYFKTLHDDAVLANKARIRQAGNNQQSGSETWKNVKSSGFLDYGPQDQIFHKLAKQVNRVTPKAWSVLEVKVGYCIIFIFLFV